ncbi:hypothetical protein AMECASPLE_009577 [Ameca splendens]|uniref:Uncharacterized protein n=1 Tax=Ameca splendens TaxID=208324 RepID=A0ABV0YMQ8_9TELE
MVNPMEADGNWLKFKLSIREGVTCLSDWSDSHEVGTIPELINCVQIPGECFVCARLLGDTWQRAQREGERHHEASRYR